MSCRLSTTTGAIARTTAANLGNSQTGTVAWWYRKESSAEGASIGRLTRSGGGSVVEVGTAGNVRGGFTSGDPLVQAAVADNEWCGYALVRTSSVSRFYLFQGGAVTQIAADSTSFSGVNLATLVLGDPGAHVDAAAGSYRFCRYWTAELTATELLAEFQMTPSSGTPAARTTNLYLSWPLATGTDTTDWGPAGNRAPTITSGSTSAEEPTIGNPGAIAAAAGGVATAAGALSTQVRLAAAAASVSSSSAALTTAIRLAAAAISQAAATGALIGAIPLAADAASSASATALFASGAVLQGAAADVAIAVAALTTQVRLGAVSIDTATATGTLVNWATVTLAGTLYEGPGGILDHHFWVDDLPVLGSVIYYDPTHMVIYPNGEISFDTNDCTALVQFMGPGGWAQGLVVATPQMAAVAGANAGASAQLTSQIRLAAAASALASATAAFSTGAGLTAAASDSATATGTLATGIPLSGLANSVATAVAALTAQIRLAAAAVSNASANADLNGVVVLAAAGTAIAASTGALTTGIRPQASAQDVASAFAALTTQVRLSGAAQAAASAAAAISTGLALGGQMNNIATASADLSTARLLVASAIDVATSVALMSTGINLQGSAAAISQASADLSGFINLLANAGASATAAATITDVIETPPIGEYESDPRFYISKPRWSFLPLIHTGKFDRKYVAEEVILTFDLSGFLGASEKLQGPIELTITATSGVDGNANALRVGVPSYDTTMKKILQPVRGGIARNVYYIKVAAKTNKQFRKVALAGLLPVKA